MGKLVLECLDRKIKIKNITKAVYMVLGQKDMLKAELVFVDEDRIQSLNRDTRGVDRVTDVLSYPTLENVRGEILKRENHPLEVDGRYLFLGSIVLCEEKIKKQAEELAHSEEEEINYLIIHGLLHLFGYDHMTSEDKKQMREKEKAILKAFGVTEE